MKFNKNIRLVTLGSAVASLAMVAGCNGNSDDDMVPPPPPPPPAATTVPNSAGASASAFFSFVRGLPVGNETSEPLGFKSDFAAPAEDLGEPAPLT